MTSSPAVNGEGLRPSNRERTELSRATSLTAGDSRATPDDGGVSYKGSLASREVSGLKGHLTQRGSLAVHGGHESDKARYNPRSTLTPGYPL
jgi:hypothetical protein